MISSLVNLLTFLVPFEKEDLEGLDKAFEPRWVKKGERLLNPGDTCREFYFVNSGCLRTYFISRAGQEKTRLILHDCSIGTALTSFIYQQPSLEAIDALEDTAFLAISHQRFYQLMRRSARWQEFYVKILEMAYAFQNRKIEDLLTLTARQRFEKLMKEQPFLLQKVSNKVLASYLDMREETLSRIKAS